MTGTTLETAEKRRLCGRILPILLLWIAAPAPLYIWLIV